MRQIQDILTPLRISQDELLTIMLATNDRHPKREWAVCPFAIRRELIWDTHKQTQAGFQLCSQSYNSGGVGHRWGVTCGSK